MKNLILSTREEGIYEHKKYMSCIILYKEKTNFGRNGLGLCSEPFCEI